MKINKKDFVKAKVHAMLLLEKLLRMIRELQSSPTAERCAEVESSRPFYGVY